MLLLFPVSPSTDPARHLVMIDEAAQRLEAARQEALAAVKVDGLELRKMGDFRAEKEAGGPAPANVPKPCLRPM